MKPISNSGQQRVIDIIRPALRDGFHFDMITPVFSLYAYASLANELQKLDTTRLYLPSNIEQFRLLGGKHDRSARNRMQNRWLARSCAQWIEQSVKLKQTNTPIPQSMIVQRNETTSPQQAVIGSFGFSSDGLGLTPANPLNFIQASETPEESVSNSQWFDAQWNAIADAPDSRRALLEHLQTLASHRPPATVYAAILNHVFQDRDDVLDEDRVIRSATGIKNTKVWNKLYKFQRDGVIGAIDKLNRFGGCIIADSVGLGKTFEALAIIKYHELRNDRVLVLCPKRLRDNWTFYLANDRRNMLSEDRLNYDVLNHTDLSRNTGRSGDIDLAHVNWGNYDLVVIDESHNFRNKITHKTRESRYARLMRRIIREGVKTRVLMLSATPVNNRLSDLKNQIAFATEGQDDAFAGYGINSIENTTRLAQRQFNRWMDKPESERTPGSLVDMLGFDYFTLLDLLTIARSRKHIEKYYGTEETGEFPDRLNPINIKPDVDLEGGFQSIRDINQEIRRLNLAAYAPLTYVKPQKQATYNDLYATRLDSGYFSQKDREQSLIHLLRVNVLKRMESSVNSFALTVQRQLQDVINTIQRIDAHADELEELDIQDYDLDDPAIESLLVGKKVKVLLNDIDLVRWKQDLVEDRNRLETLLSQAQQVDAARDAKLAALKQVIDQKLAKPINPGNKKILVFTAFADTAIYLYEHLAPWMRECHGVQSALVTGAGRNKTTVPGMNKDLASILSAFSPLSKERPEEFSAEGHIDLLIATDCISEGQNLQDCDCVINYDIHWNPVRIIQRFGRIDRIGSPNSQIQLVNFWPNMELNEYIQLEQRVSGKMILLDVSATGEENVFTQESGNQMNDLEYRRAQLMKLQDAVIDLEDLSSGVSITDLTLNDFRIDLAEYLKDHPGDINDLPLGLSSVISTTDADVPPGTIFCLCAEAGPAAESHSDNYPLTPYYLVHVGDDGAVLLTFTQAKLILDRLKRLCVGRDMTDAAASARHDRATKHGEDMRAAQKLLAAAIGSITGKAEERAVDSLFTPGGTSAFHGDFSNIDDFEIIAWLTILPHTANPA